MKTSSLISLVLILMFSCFSLIQAQSTCTSHKFSNGKSFAACSDLPVLDSYLHWNYHPTTHRIDIAFRHTGDTADKWIAWAINPSSTHMIGSQAIVALRKTSDGSLISYTSPITSYRTLLREGNLSFQVQDLSAEYEKEEIVIFANVQLPGNSTVVNHVWQVGPVLAGDVPGRHAMSPANMKSSGTIDFISGKVEASKDIDWNRRIHGALNGLSWGFLMPIGVLVARYLKVVPAADPAWFKIHRSCQSLAGLMGLGGMLMGVWLGSLSSGIQYTSHLVIGIVLPTLCVPQIVIACFFRPDKDSKNRIYFNILHRVLGYATTILGVVNCILGLNILKSKTILIAYASFIGALVFIAILLDVILKCGIIKFKKKEFQESTSPVESII